MSLMEVIANQITEYESESRIYEDLVGRGSDVFESAKASSFFDGKAEALTEVLDQLEALLPELVEETLPQAV